VWNFFVVGGWDKGQGRGEVWFPGVVGCFRPPCPRESRRIGAIVVSSYADVVVLLKGDGDRAFYIRRVGCVPRRRHSCCRSEGVPVGGGLEGSEFWWRFLIFAFPGGAIALVGVGET